MGKRVTIRPDASERLVTGSVAGLIATVPMTVVMVASYKLGTSNRSEETPPSEITRNVVDVVNTDLALNALAHAVMTIAGHLSYGALCGKVYGLCFPNAMAPRAHVGSLYGLSVWVVSYLGWLPLLRLYPPANRQSARHNLSMIVAHVVWGACLAQVIGVLTMRRRQAALEQEAKAD